MGSESKKILVLGGTGLVGSGIKKELSANNDYEILSPVRGELDLMSQSQCFSYFSEHKPDVVFFAAAVVGGIVANNTYRADFIYKNLVMECNVFGASFESKVDKLFFLGSTCIYPKMSPQPIKEEYLLTGELEPTNEPYAIAKIAGLKMAEAFRSQYGCEFISIMPTNLYGKNDNFSLEGSHVIPGLIARLKQAMDKGEKEFKIWGSGRPRREFLYVDDLAKACHFLMKHEGVLPDMVNVGSGKDVTIDKLACMIVEKMGYTGKVLFDSSKPDGTPQKLSDISRMLDLGWTPSVELSEGLDIVIEHYLSSANS